MKKAYKFNIINSKTKEILDRCNDLIESRLIAHDYEKYDKIHAHVIINPEYNQEDNYY